MKPNVAHEWNNIHKFVGSSFNYQPINKQLNKHSQALTTSGLGWRALYIPEILSAVRSKRIVQEWQNMMTFIMRTYSSLPQTRFKIQRGLDGLNT